METEMEQTKKLRSNHGTSPFPERSLLNEEPELLAHTHACKASQHALEQANDHLRRANRDLGELAGFIAASLTTVTAIEAVINIAIDKIGLPTQILQTAFDLYIGLLGAILILGAVRFGVVMRRRGRAEKELDLAKRAIYRYCPMPQQHKAEE
jgi:hypothetical protein